jgi:molybdopterin-containing oxidoreductase family membrane subunit
VLVDAGMFVERYFIVVTGLRAPLMPYDPVNYAPTWVEWSITLGGFAFFALLVTVFVRLFPIMAVYEMVEERREQTQPPPSEPEPVPAGVPSPEEPL